MVLSSFNTGSVIGLMTDAVIRCLDVESARRLLDMRIDPAVQERLSVLAAKSNEGLLTDYERAEYEACISADDFIAVLKLKARRHFSDLVAPGLHGADTDSKK